MNKVLRATLVSAVVITAVIGIASFVLSFAALWDLATMAGVPRNLSWLWPVIVDGTILQATISVIALAQFEDQRSGRRFFWWVLVIAALVSIGANAMHAFISGAGSLHPALSAAIATVAPVSLLAATHGLGILVRIPAQAPEPVQPEEKSAIHSPEDRKPMSWNDIGTDDPMAHNQLPTSAQLPTPAKRPAPAPTPAPISEPVDELPAEPLEDMDRWILDEDRADDLYPVEAP